MRAGDEPVDRERQRRGLEEGAQRGQAPRRRREGDGQAQGRRTNRRRPVAISLWRGLVSRALRF